jgi:excisionase family DNA binding protein
MELYMREKMMTIPKLADKMGLSRVAVYKKVKSGKIPATKVGRIYVIATKDVKDLLPSPPSKKELKWVDEAVKREVQEYGMVFKWLSTE